MIRARGFKGVLLAALMCVPHLFGPSTTWAADAESTQTESAPEITGDSDISCSNLKEILDPRNHPTKELGNNWVLGPVTKRAGTVEVLLFHYREAAPVEGADVGPLSLLLRPTVAAEPKANKALVQLDGNWRGQGPSPPDVEPMIQWIRTRIQVESVLMDRIFSLGSRGGKREICYAGFPGTSLKPQEEPPGGGVLSLEIVLIRFELILLFFLLLLLARQIPMIRSTEKENRLLYPWWIVSTVVGLVLRVVITPSGVYHENHHGFLYLEAVMEGDPRLLEAFTSSFFVAFHHLVNLVGGNDETLFRINALLSSLCAPLLGLLFLRLGGYKWSGIIAAFMWALSPIAIRLGPTECIGNFSLFFFLMGSVCLTTVSRNFDSLTPRTRAAFYGAGSLCLALGAQSRALTLVHPLWALGLLIAAPGLLRPRIMRWVGLAMLGTVVLELPWLVSLWSTVMGGMGDAPFGVRCLMQKFHPDHSLFLSPAVVAPTLVPLALFGIVGWGRNHQTSGFTPRFFAAATPILAFCLAGMVCGDIISQSRHQFLAFALLTGFAAVGAAHITQILIRSQRIAGALFAALITLSPLLSVGFVHRSMQAGSEYEFLVDEVVPHFSESRAPVTLVVPSAKNPVVPIPSSWFARKLPDANVVRHLGNEPTPKTTSLAYIGLGCYWTNQGERYPAFPAMANLPINPACIRGLTSGQWVPLLEKKIPRPSTHGSLLAFPHENVTIGLYRAEP